MFLPYLDDYPAEYENLPLVNAISKKSALIKGFSLTIAAKLVNKVSVPPSDLKDEMARHTDYNLRSLRLLCALCDLPTVPPGRRVRKGSAESRHRINLKR